MPRIPPRRWSILRIRRPRSRPSPPRRRYHRRCRPRPPFRRPGPPPPTLSSSIPAAATLSSKPPETGTHQAEASLARTHESTGAQPAAVARTSPGYLRRSTLLHGSPVPQIATPEPQASPLRNSASSLPPAPGAAPSALELGATFPAVMGSPALRAAPVLSKLEEPTTNSSHLGDTVASTGVTVAREEPQDSGRPIWHSPSPADRLTPRVTYAPTPPAPRSRSSGAPAKRNLPLLVAVALVLTVTLVVIAVVANQLSHKCHLHQRDAPCWLRGARRPWRRAQSSPPCRSPLWPLARIPRCRAGPARCPRRSRDALRRLWG